MHSNESGMDAVVEKPVTSHASKGILKKQPKNPPAGSSSWLTRIQSKMYTPAADVPFGAPALSRQELKRVTFSVKQLTTEHLLYDVDDIIKPNQQASNDVQQHQDTDNNTKRNGNINSDNNGSNNAKDLPLLYDRACRLREEPLLDHFREQLQLNCRRQAGPIADILLMGFGLRQLQLSNCSLDDETLRILLHGLLVKDEVTELDLSNNRFKVDGFRFIAIYISESRTIQSLDLSQCLPDKQAIRYLSRAISIAPSLAKLFMDRCSLKPSLFEVLTEGVRQSSTLTCLSLQRNGINRHAAPWLTAILFDEEPIETQWQLPSYSRHGLQQLDLTGNNLHLTMPSLTQALCNNSSLTHLLLADCHLYPEDCVFLMEALVDNHRLQVLDLSQNPIASGSDEGIQSIKYMLSKNCALYELSLADTDLDASAAIALAECLPENTTLCRLDLSNNPHITMAGVLALSISIKMNETLTFLDINIAPDDNELARLQNEIVAICTQNMQRAYELNELAKMNAVAQQATPPSSVESSSMSPMSQGATDLESDTDTSMDSVTKHSSDRYHGDTPRAPTSSFHVLENVSLVDDIAA